CDTVKSFAIGVDGISSNAMAYISSQNLQFKADLIALYAWCAGRTCNKRMNLKQTQLHILRQPQKLTDRAKTGVSLHCHTEHSKEMLDFIPHYATRLPIIAHFYRKE